MRSALKGEEYPAMVHTGNDQNYVSGVFCQNLTVKDLNSLDVFEGEVSYLSK
jgi:MOSC domain-containing protein YiiM